tara:strand:- start:629 stop:838 length:210 start_codon:yes stop_codon:yes gene_type:complete
MTTQKEIRVNFWINHPEFKKGYKKNKSGNYVAKSQNDYNTDIRCYFCDYVENLRCNGVITESLSNRATL